ncbi:MAG TPA: hypothetical protein VJ824_01215 [Bacillota bacterium]|nr:hypothetical protein [Bacillota bacterium]
MNSQIPEGIQHSSLKRTIVDLLESIALEETAVSSILRAEAGKIKAFVGKNLEFPSNPSTKEILLFNETVNKMMDSLLMTEWLLLRKLDAIIQIDIHKMEQELSFPFVEKDSLWEDSVIIEESSFNIESGLEKNDFTEKETLKFDDGDEGDFYW